MEKWTKKAKRNVKIFVVLGSVILIWGAFTNWKFFSIAPADVTPPASSGDITMHVFNTDGVELEDASIAVSDCDISELTTSEVNDLDSGDFTAKNTYESGDDFEPEDEFLYMGEATLLGYTNAYILLTPGDNVIIMTQAPTSVSMLCYSSPSLNTTVANATETDWTIVVHMLDSEGETNSSVGYNPYTNFGTAVDYEHWGVKNQYLLVNVTFYTVPTTESASIDGYTASKSVTDYSVLLQLSCGIMGSAELPLEFGSNVATLQPKSISLRWGNSSVNTQLAVQA